jgi:hypothetical protein
MFCVLIMTLPTQPAAVRLRVWRALKALGCAVLRDGAYLLPLEHAPALEALAAQVQEHGGTASVLHLSPRDAAQERELLARFDRSDTYQLWQQGGRELLAQLGKLTETEARRRLRGVADALQALAGIDYYPGAAALQAHDELVQLRQAVDQRFSRGEPHPVDGDVQRADRAKFQRKRWVTRCRPWVDRLASAWLIRRFIDPQARLSWLPDPARAPRGAIGYDFDGARFTHVGQRVTFEVLMAGFALEHDARLAAIAGTVHYLDAGGIAAAQAAGVEAVLGGLREIHADDAALQQAADQVFDALYAVPVDSAHASTP